MPRLPIPASWSGHGINYNGTVNVDSDLDKIRQYWSRIRVSYPAYNNSADIAIAKTIATKAVARGFTEVVVGMTVPVGCNATQWAAYKLAVLDFASWAQSNGVTRFSVGNEIGMRLDGTTITAVTARADQRGQLATDAKAIFTRGQVTCEDDMDSIDLWVSEGGIGSLDRAGFNLYGSIAQFRGALRRMLALGVNRLYVSEYNDNSGYNGAGNDLVYAEDVARQRSGLIRNAGIESAYWYNYQFDSDVFSVLLSDGSTTRTFGPLTGGRTLIA